MVNQLRQFTSRILLVDNNSTSPELLEYYDSLERDTGVKVIRMRKNYGHTVVLYEHLPTNESVFAVTDPDLQLNARTPPDMLEHLLALTEEFKIGKAGLALNISDALPWRQFNISPREWEKRFWTDRLNTSSGLEVYRAEIDTTFAVYNRRFSTGRYTAVRVAGEYTAMHLPWFDLPQHLLGIVDEEFYLNTRHAGSGSWIPPLASRYKHLRGRKQH